MKLNLDIENSFRSDTKKLYKRNIIVQDEIEFVVEKLLNQESLDKKYKDHALKGDYKGYRDCHISSDLVLVYKIQNDTLYLSRIGRHRDIFKKYS
ncbi:type II toxin-antitoxin system YafQ family toxin [Helicobacter sp. 23-1044]